MLLPFAAALAVLLAADPTPVNPASEKPDASAPPAGKKADDQKIVCREEGRANSRFKQQVCLTKKEWAERERAAEEAARELANKPVISTAKGN